MPGTTTMAFKNQLLNHNRWLYLPLKFNEMKGNHETKKKKTKQMKNVTQSGKTFHISEITFKQIKQIVLSPNSPSSSS